MEAPLREQSKNRHIILCCSCMRQDKKALEVHAQMFPDVPVEVVKGRDRLAKLADQLSNSHIRAISRLSGRFAYLEVLSPNNDILEEYNLLTKRRIA